MNIYALDVIYRYGGWQVLESILFAISNEQGFILDKAKNLLERWMLKSCRLYSKPDSVVMSKIAEFFDVVRNKEILSGKTLKELSFIIETTK